MRRILSDGGSCAACTKVETIIGSMNIPGHTHQLEFRRAVVIKWNDKNVGGHCCEDFIAGGRPYDYRDELLERGRSQSLRDHGYVHVW